MAKITLIGMSAYFARLNDDLFKNLTLPAGLEKDTLVDNILNKGSEFETIYGDPEFMQASIGTWSAVNARTFKRWVDALNIEYAPLENYNRFEDWEDNRETEGNTNTQSTGTTTNESENKRSAFDSSEYQPNSKDLGEVGTEDSVESSNTVNDNAVHSGHIHGNIGVTTSQQMLRDELDLGYWNIYEKITELFLREFTIPVYV